MCAHESLYACICVQALVLANACVSSLVSIPLSTPMGAESILVQSVSVTGRTSVFVGVTGHTT